MARTPGGVAASWPLVGRDRELGMIREALGAGASGVVIGGAAGVGKTRLARHALDDGAGAGAFVVRARATRSSVGIPLGAFGAYLPAGAQPASDAGHIQGVIAALRAQAGDRELMVGVDDAQLLEAADTFAAIAVNHYACEAAAHASAAFAAEGRQDSARRAAARSRELQPAEQGAQPVSIEGVDRDAIELTPREAQMVELAARGLTNGEIAETLVLSSRTVETHIYRAMRKLGVSDRRDFRPAPASSG